MVIPCWETIDVSSSRRPLLNPSEVVLYVQSHVGLYDGKNKALDYQDGVIYLTGTRICYVDRDKPALRSISLDLAKIDKVEHYAGFLKSNPKITIRFKSLIPPASDDSGRTTPSVSVGMKTKHGGDWVCPICTFSNLVPPTHLPGAPLPACVNCGMKPPKSIKVSTSSQNSTPAVSRPGSAVSQGVVQRNVAHTTSTHGGAATFTCPRCTFGNHPAITNCEICGAPLISNNLPPLLKSNQNTDERNLALLLSPESSIPSDKMSCKLSFRSAGDKQFFDRLRRAIADQGWLDAALTVEQISIDDADLKPRRGAGISALQNRETIIRSSDAHIMSGAFEDLEGLMARAKEMIALAESFAARISNAPASASGTLEARSLLSESSSALGLATPVVTKESTGKSGVFHSELARQISEFLENGLLRREGGSITLVDLYAVYNRARKGSLISPDDLFSACQRLDDLKLPIRLRKFRSGIVVVQDRDRNDASTRQMVLKWIKERTLGVSALDAAERFGWSVGVATEELELVEEYGDIVRDTGIEGLRFYENRMAHWDHRAWYPEQFPDG